MATENDDFAAAFEDAVTVADKEPAPTPGSDMPKGEDKPAGDLKGEVKPTEKADDVDPEPTEEEKKPAEEVAAKEKADKEAADKAAKDAADRIKDIKEKARADAEARREIEREEAAKKASEEEAAKKAAATFPDLVLSDEEKAAVDQLGKDWPEAKKALDVILKQREHSMKALFTGTFQKVLEHVYKDIADLRDNAETSTEERHFSAMSRAHADLDTILPPGKEDEGPLKQWIDKQPTIYKGALERVYNEGTTAEMIELISTFKEATGKKPTGGEDEEAKAKAAEAEAEKARKAAGLAAVPSKRTVVRTGQPDPNNFDAAFEEATADERPRR